MKKFFTLFMTGILIVAMAACTNMKSNDNTTTENNNSLQNTENQASKSNDNSSKGTGTEKFGKTLVVYYSATGTTEKVAKDIANLTNADIFVIEPESEYTSDDLDWTDDNSRVSREHNDSGSRDVKLKTVTPNDFENYNTVFIGYPIWWGIAAWPVNNFVKENDFTGKNVIPFCTAASSDIGESGKLLSEMAGTGEWKEGQRFYSRSSADEIKSWLESLN